MSAIGIEHLKPSRKTRISARVKTAIRLMVDLGRSRADAAKESGITDDWLYRALEKPECRAYRAHLMQVFRESAASRSLARIDNLADSSDSDHVKLQANVHLLAIEGVSAVQKSENVSIHKNLTPGLTLNLIMAPQAIDDPRVIDGQTRHVETRSIPNGLPQPVPHPSAGNAQPVTIQPAKREGRAAATRGGKTARAKGPGC